MKKKLRIMLLVGALLYVPNTRSINWLDFFATWLVASYAYHAWCSWMQYSHSSNDLRPPDEVIRDLRECLKALRNKVVEEQQEIREVRQDIAELRKEISKQVDRTEIIAPVA